MKFNTNGKWKMLAFFLYRNKDAILKIIKEYAPKVIAYMKTFIGNRKK